MSKNTQTKKEDLIKELTLASNSYYQGEQSPMTDEEYDTKLEYLKSIMTADEITQSKLFSSPSSGTTPLNTTVNHAIPMLSLAKAKDLTEISKWKQKVDKHCSTYCVQWKMDGLAGSIVYENGRIKHIATRGDGEKGELLNYLLKEKNLKILGISERINNLSKIELRGEFYLSNQQFNDINSKKEELQENKFSNQRNAVVGIIKKANKGLDFYTEISFVIYSAFIDNQPINLLELKLDKEFKTIDQLTQETFNSKEYIVDNEEDLHTRIKQMGEVRNSLPFLTDGVVIKPAKDGELLSLMGNTSHHPLAYIAYKYSGEVAFAKVLDVVLQVGRTGRITPVAKIEPTSLSGTIISSISLHNFSIINDLDVRIGSTVVITRANDVIPHIIKVIAQEDNSKPIPVPTHCPICGSPLYVSNDLKTIECLNEDCDSRQIGHILSVVSKSILNIEGLSTSTIESLYEQKIIRDFTDLFTLDVKTLADLKNNNITFGTSRANKVINSIQFAKENTPEYKLLAMLNIKNLGLSTSKLLIEHFGDIYSVLNASKDQLTNVDGIGLLNAQYIVEKQNQSRQLLDKLISLGFKINQSQQKSETKGSFAISGSVEGFSNREDFAKYLESLGYTYHSSIKKDTTYLFADPNSTSSKVLKAKKNGTKIIQSISELQ